MNLIPNISIPRLPRLPHFDGPMDVLLRTGAWVWAHWLSRFWRDLEGWPAWCWVLPCLVISLLALFTWRRWAGTGFAYRAPRLFNFVHGRIWLPLLVSCLWGSILFGVPLLALSPGPAWRPGSWFCLTGRQALVVLGVGALATPFVVLWVMVRLVRSQVPDGIHGSAAWAARREVRVAPKWPWLLPIRVHFRGSRRPWLGGGGLVVLAPSREVANRHILIRGGTGSGKGYFVLGHILATARHATIYQDLKAECPHLDHLRAVTGSEPLRWGAAADGGWPSLQWNPLEECRLDPSPQDAYETLAAVLISGEDRDWVPQLARPILAWVLASGHYQSLGELADDFTERGVEPVLKDIGLPGGLIQSLEGKNVKEYIGTTIFSHLAPFRSGWGREVTSGHDFSLADIIKRGGYVLSAETVATRRAPLIVFWRLLFRRMLRTTEPMDLTLLMDEGLAAGKIPDFADALNSLRSKGVSIVFAIQNTAGLRDIYGPQGGPAVEEAFTNRITLLNGLNSDDAEKLSKRLGTYTRIRKQVKVTPTHDRADLIPLEEVARRGAGEKDRWAVFEVVGATTSNRPIIARLVPSELVIRKPKPSEIASREGGISGPLPEVQKEEAESQPPWTPEIPADAAAEELGGF